MSRTPKRRLVASPPLFSSFKPSGIAGTKLLHVNLELDEYEAIRLADYKGMEHEQASEAMNISRSTFTRLLERARQKVSRLLVEGVKLNIDGGTIHFKDNLYQCQACRHFFALGIHDEASVCPMCASKDLVNFAQKFGHGTCCMKGNLQ
ncbi:MAG: DUF134 domain-containing protein [Campylobacteraceae bacterium]|nr:DUF134 domain-containing protein [Campylobacteraceae bacterium]